LPHTGIDDWKTGSAIGPSLKLIFIVSPFDLITTLVKGVTENMRKMKSNVAKKVPPVKLPQQGMFIA
jgi:hypothetical protein